MIKHSYLTDKVVVRYSSIHRRGIFAINPIRKDEIISVWGGFIITGQEFIRLGRKKFKEIENYATKIADGFYLVSCKKGGLEDDDFFNHSCCPNAGIKGHLLMVAMRNISAGEEITYDYAMTDADFDTLAVSNTRPSGRNKNKLGGINHGRVPDFRPECAERSDYCFRCSCGTPDCRKVITTRDWEIRSLQKRYKGYFSWYVQERINQQGG